MKRAVLIVEDQGLIRRTLEVELKNLGYRVVAVDDGEKALSALCEEKFHLVISDMRLGMVTGLEVLCEAKRIDQDIRFIMISGASDLVAVADCFRAGLDDFVKKPFDFAQFIALAQSYLSPE